MGRYHVSSRPLWLTENECLPVIVCGAIEMAGVITIKFTVMKDGMAQLGMKSPIYIPGPVEPQFGPGRYIYFEGFSVDEIVAITGLPAERVLAFVSAARDHLRKMPGLAKQFPGRFVPTGAA